MATPAPGTSRAGDDGVSAAVVNISCPECDHACSVRVEVERLLRLRMQVRCARCGQPFDVLTALRGRGRERRPAGTPQQRRSVRPINFDDARQSGRPETAELESVARAIESEPPAIEVSPLTPAERAEVESAARTLESDPPLAVEDESAVAAELTHRRRLDAWLGLVDCDLRTLPTTSGSKRLLEVLLPVPNQTDGGSPPGDDVPGGE